MREMVRLNKSDLYSNETEALKHYEQEPYVMSFEQVVRWSREFLMEEVEERWLQEGRWCPTEISMATICMHSEFDCCVTEPLDMGNPMYPTGKHRGILSSQRMYEDFIAPRLGGTSRSVGQASRATFTVQQFRVEKQRANHAHMRAWKPR